MRYDGRNLTESVLLDHVFTHHNNFISLFGVDPTDEQLPQLHSAHMAAHRNALDHIAGNPPHWHAVDGATRENAAGDHTISDGTVDWAELAESLRRKARGLRRQADRAEKFAVDIDRYVGTGLSSCNNYDVERWAARDE